MSYKLLAFLLATALWFACAASAQDPILPDLSIVNGASYEPGTNALAPGSMAAIFGTNLTDGTSCIQAAGCSQSFDANGRLRTTLAGAQVLINGSPVPIFHAAPGNLGIQIPTDLTGTSATIQVAVGGRASETRSFRVAPFSPGIFTTNQQGTGQGVITHSDGSIVSPRNPAHPGETVIIYATGLGSVTPSLATGARTTTTTRTLTTPAVTVDGLPAAVQFSGAAGCCVGLNQVNVVVPPNVRASGDVNVSLEMEGSRSNTVALYVAAPPAANLSGVWRGSWSASDVSGTLSWTATQSGSSISGPLSGGNSYCFASGTMSGTLIGSTLQLTAVSPGNPTSLSFSGTFTATEMSGTYVVVGGVCDGDFGFWNLSKVN